MPPPRPKGISYTAGVASTRPSSNTPMPMSERQQMALLIQMTATTATTDAPRTQTKKNEHKKSEGDVEESNSNDKHNDTQETSDKTEDNNVEIKKDAENSNTQLSSNSKRSYSDLDEDEYDDIDESKKKKKKDPEKETKETKNATNVKVPPRQEKTAKQPQTVKAPPSQNKSNTTALEKESNDANKPTENEIDIDSNEELKNNESIYSGSLKVPPLKIVIPQQNCSIDTEGNVLRTGKITTSRNAALPYVVSSNSESNEKDTNSQCSSPNETSTKANTIGGINTGDEKNFKIICEEKTLRVLRSSHRSGVASAERSSNNSSPQLQSSSPSPASSATANETTDIKTYSNMTSSPMQQSQTFDQENIVNLPSPSTSSTSSSKEINTTSNVELHPRKRKIRSKTDNDIMNKSSTSNANTNNDAASVSGETHPHELPFTNGFQMYLNIRRQIEKKWKNLYPVKPRPPQGYNEYLLTKKTYLLQGNAEEYKVKIPNTVSEQMRNIYVLQDKERHDLTLRHTVEREKLCLNVEQEIIRVHSKAARNISCQMAPYSVCTFLKDDEVYNLITPDQDEKDKSARCRFNGRLLLSWLQDVDDKWEKIKDSMVLRHHNEAESLHAVQLMDWEIALKKYNLCDCKYDLNVDKDHVPIVYVSDDFDLLPA